MAAYDGASSSSSSSVPLSTHDVFLSFRGEDTRNNFTGFLHRDLKREGIHVFIDSEGLWGGEEIQTALLDAIQRSKILIPIFSKGYADSKWCLMELVEIVRYHRSNNQKVLPVFLDVEPRDVRHQTGSFESSFQKHMGRYDAQKIQSWKDALTEVAGKSGYELKQVNGYQPELVKLVVKWVLSELSSNCLSDVKNPVGLDARVEHLLSRLKVDSNDVLFVGICAIGGMGKTSIAKTLYNRIFKSFEMSCFLGNVREEASSGPNGVVSLQEKLIYSVSKKEEKICIVDRGKHLIKEKLQGKKVLLIVDDVDSHSQLKDLAIESISFGPGSRIIITTRDEHILNVAKVDGDNIYRPEELDDKQSLQLFSLHAFSSDQPPEDYRQLSYDVVHLAGGLPLTLEVLGSTFSDKENREEEVWKSMLQELKRIPHDDVYNKLKISFDNLKDHEKSIFLDVACFFVGQRKETMISMWDACGFNPISAINKLTQRSLLKFIRIPKWRDPYDALWMHDQIQAMGKGIVYEESPTEPSKRSRLWSDEECLEAIEEPEGAQMLEVICRQHKKFIKGFFTWDDIPQPLPHRRNFAMMSKLRVLDVDEFHHVNREQSKGDFPYLPPNLRWFNWNGLTVPPNFYHKKLVHMDLSWSQSREAWTNKPQNKDERFQKLKVLHLNHCEVSHKYLDFSWFPYLEKLDLERCSNIVNLHKSIGDLKSLVELNLGWTSIEELPNSICGLSSLKVLTLEGWALKTLPEAIGDVKSLVKLNLKGTRIKEIPSSICKLSCLEVLILQGCASLKNLPMSIGDLKSLVKLDLEETQIEELPSSISELSSLTMLNLNSCGSLNKLPDGVWLLEKLEKLKARNCDSLVKLPTSWGRMKCLRIINLIGTRILLPSHDFVMLPSLVKLYIGNDLESSLPPWISGLPQLQQLILSGYTKLESLPDLPSTLTFLKVHRCSSLQTLSDLSSLSHLTVLYIDCCEELKEIRGFEGIVESLERLIMCNCKYLEGTPRWKIHGQGTLLVNEEELPGFDNSLVDEMSQGLVNEEESPGVDNSLVDEMSQGIDVCSLNVNDRIYTGLIFCVVFQCRLDCLQEGQLIDISLSIEASIHHRKQRWINDVRHQVLIEGVEYTAKRDIIYVHHFGGFDWFGIPLDVGMDAVKVRHIGVGIVTSPYLGIPISYTVKFWRIFLESTASEQQQQQITNQEEESTTPTTIARWMVSDFFKWSDDEDHGRSHHFTSSSNAVEIEGSDPIPQQELGLLPERLWKCILCCLNCD